MTSDESSDDQLGPLIDEFLERRRLGEVPSVTEFIRRHPTLADDIRDLFPAIALMEQIEASGDASRGNDDPGLSQLGDYRIIRTIGRGGMGTVYEAVQESLGRHVAIKVLPAQAVADRIQVERFQREAQVAAALHHAHIVPVFGVGEADGIHFFAMQFIRGQSLDHVLNEIREQAGSAAHYRLDGSGSQSSPDNQPESDAADDHDAERHFIRRVAEIGAQAAAALAYSHGQGVVHRDIKPANLMLDAKGNIWIADFGLAKAHDLSGQPERTSDLPDLTRTGDLLGTLRYMPPERFNGISDASGDIYSLGLTLYELLTRVPAFQDSDRVTLIRQVTSTTPLPPCRHNARIPRDLETIVLTAIDPNPASRYLCATDLMLDLQLFLAGRPIVARPTPWFVRARLWAIRNKVVSSLLTLVCTLLIALTATGVTSFLRLQERADQINTSLEETKVAEQKARDAETLERTARIQQQRALFDSLLMKARAFVDSKAPDSKHEAMSAIRDLVKLPEFQRADAQKRQEIRDLAIHFLSLVSFRVDSQIVDRAPGRAGRFPNWPLDSNVARYARTLDDGSISIRRISDGQETNRLPGLGALHADVDQPQLRFSPCGKMISEFARPADMKSNPDDHWFVAAWEIESGREICRLKVGDQLGLEAICDFSPDGRLFATFRDVDRIEFIDTTTCDTHSTVSIDHSSGHRTSRALQFNTDGTQLACTRPGYGGGVEIIAAPFDRASNSWSVNSTAARVIDWNPGNDLIATDAGIGIQIIDTNLPNEQPAFFGFHESGIQALSFSPEGDLLASAGDDPHAYVWDTTTQEIVARFEPHSNVKFSIDGRWLGMSLAGRRVTRWKIDRSKACRLFGESPAFARRGFGIVSSVSFSHDQKFLATSTNMGVRVYDVATGKIRGQAGTQFNFAMFDPTPNAPRPFAAETSNEPNDNDGSRPETVDPLTAKYRLFVHGNDEEACLQIDETAEDRTAFFARRHSFFHRVGTEPLGYELASTDTGELLQVVGDTIRLLDHNYEPIQSIVAVKDDIPASIVISPDGRWVACDPYYTPNFFASDAKTGEQVAKFSCYDGTQAVLCFSPDSRILAASDEDSCRLFSTDNWQLQRTILHEETGIGAVTFSPDSQLIAIGESSFVKLVETGSGKLLARLKGPRETQRKPAVGHFHGALSFSPDGTLLAIGTHEYLTELWDLNSLREELSRLSLDW